MQPIPKRFLENEPGKPMLRASPKVSDKRNVSRTNTSQHLGAVAIGVYRAVQEGEWRNVMDDGKQA